MPNSAVEALVRKAPGAVEELVARGVGLDTQPDGSLALALEGGHTARRTVHAGDSATGRALTDRLIELVQASPAIDVRQRTAVLALWSDQERCAGVITDRGPVAAGATVLATGGGAALWARTTNPYGAIAAGSVLAHAPGADLADLEFCQFHPTALALPGSDHDGTLLTEALRGEDATLLDASGQRFTDELAPRDVLTAAILDRMDTDGANHLRRDLRSIDPGRFPNVFAACRDAGLVPEREPVPVAPAAHYLIGGILCDLYGRTTLPGLYTVGECVCTGVHGANRLASNSLTECLVFGARAAQAAVAEAHLGHSPPLPEWRFTPPTVQTRAATWRLAGPRRQTVGIFGMENRPLLVKTAHEHPRGRSRTPLVKGATNAEIAIRQREHGLQAVTELLAEARLHDPPLLDVFSRYIVAWTVQYRELGKIAEALIAQACEQQRITREQLTLHADRGIPMRSKPVTFLLADLGVLKTHSRPYTSSDNPYSEAQFKTLKYRPEFPERFDSIEHAREHCQHFFHWYNHEHNHSGIGLMTPAAVHYGEAQRLYDQRADVLTAAYARNPERFVRKPPVPPELPAAVWINKPEDKELAH